MATGWLLDLIRPYGLGSEVLAGVTLERASDELGLRLTFSVDGDPLHVDVSPAQEGTPHAARSERLMFGYRVGRGAVDSDMALALCAKLAAAAKANETRVLASLSAEAAEGRIRHVEAERLLEPMGGGEQRFYGLSPYVGCLIGCRFCYAPSRLDPLRRLLGIASIPWGSWTDVRTNAPALLERELAERPKAPIKLCPIVSDPYHAIERKEELTRRCLAVLAERASDWPLFVLTRSPLVRRDFDLLGRLDEVHVGVSLPTADDEVRAHFEPRAASVADRLDTLALAREVGLRTFAMVQPMLPGDLETMTEALAAHADSVSLDVLRGVQGATEDFADSRFAEAATDAWQAQRATELRDALQERGVPIWAGELPPER